jgi:flagellar motor switch protein FliM
LLDEFAAKAMGALSRLTSLAGEIEIAGLELGPMATLAPDAENLVSAHFAIREWKAPAVVALERALLFRLLDSMYGGDGGRRGKAPARQLTGLEREIAGRIAGAVLSELSQCFARVCPFGFMLEHLESLPAPEGFDAAGEYLVIRLRLTDRPEQLVVAVPSSGLEYARERLTSPGERDEPSFDPNWNRTFQRNIGATDVELVAVAVGPPMTLGDVARLEPGSLVEFDATSLQHVRLISSDLPVYEGRLGQSKGSFTVLLEMALASSGPIGS